MSQSRTLPLLGLLLLLQCRRFSAQQDDLDCPPGTHFSNGKCISSMRVRFTQDESGSGFSGGGNNNFGSGGSGNNNYGSGSGGNNNRPSGNSYGNDNGNFGNNNGNSNFGNSNGNGNFGNNNGNNGNNGGYGQRKPSSSSNFQRPSNSNQQNKAPRPRPKPSAPKNPCPAGYILSNGICKPAYLHPLPTYPKAPYALPPNKCNPYGHYGYPFSSLPQLQQHPYHSWPYGSQALNPYASLSSLYGYPYHGAQYPHYPYAPPPPYLNSQLCPPGYTFVLGTGCKSPQRVSINKLSRDSDVTEDEDEEIDKK